MTDNMTLADLRRQAGLTQREVGERMGLSAGQVQRYEALYPDISFTAVWAYIEALGGRVQFKRGEAVVNAAAVVQDPALAGTRSAYRNDPQRFARGKHSTLGAA